MSGQAINSFTTEAWLLLDRWRKGTGKPGPFTPEASRALWLAEAEVRRLNHNFLGTEHILLALIKLGQGGAFDVLQKMGLKLDTLSVEIERQIGVGHELTVTGRPPFSGRFKRAIALAQQEAKNLNHPYVGTGHLLLGLLHEGSGVAALVLSDLGIFVGDTRREFLDVVARNMSVPAADTSAAATGSDKSSNVPPTEYFSGYFIANETPGNVFTPRAQQSLALARKEAERLNHNFIGTEHVLLGLIVLGRGVAVNVLLKLGLDFETVRKEVEKFVGVGPVGGRIGQPIPYTPRVKKSLALAQREAQSLNHIYVGTEHILLGLLREDDGVAPRVLKSLGVDLEKVRHEVLRELEPNFVFPEESEPSEQTQALTSRQGRGDNQTPKVSPVGAGQTEYRREHFVAGEKAISNFTPNAQQALTLARKEADLYNHNFLGTEHVLLGLINLEQGVPVTVLQKLGLDLQIVRMEVWKQVGMGSDPKMIGNVPYTPRVKKVLELARREARSLNRKDIGTSHILLGLLLEGDGIAGRVLKDLGVDIKDLRRGILREPDPEFQDIGGADSSKPPEQTQPPPRNGGENQTPDVPPSDGGQTG